MSYEKKLAREQREKAEKKRKRLRFLGLIGLTVAVIAAVVITVFAVRSCEETFTLEIGQPYDAGKATVTVTDIGIKRLASKEQVYAIITLKVEAEKDFTLDPYDFELDGTAPMSYSDADGVETTTDETKVSAGQTVQVRIAFLVPRSMKVSFLTYKKAVIRLGSMIENDNNLSEERK